MSKAKTEVTAEGIKDMVKRAVQEALTSHKEKKPNKQNVIMYDTTRRQGMDLRDPRAQEIQWPCFGQHLEKKHGNRFGHWVECTKCGLRMWYEPEISAPGEAHEGEPSDERDGGHYREGRPSSPARRR